MSWWLKFIIIWLNIDLVILATSWYAVYTLKRYFPRWWEKVIACEVEADLAFQSEIIETPNYMAEPEAVE